MPKKTISDLPKTVHGGLAWRLAGVEDFSHNLNPFGPPGDLREIVNGAIASVDHYPDDSCTEFRQTLADAHNVDLENVIAGAGSSELIRAFPNAFISEGDGVVIPRPSFAEYTQQCRIVGANIIDNLLLEPYDFRLSTDTMPYQLSKNVKAYYICNPNNPTGRVEPRDKILGIVEECEKRNILVFLDETLLELVPSYKDVSCVEYVKDHSNLMIIGSLTKSYAIPGIRVGYGFSNPDMIETLDKIRLPWNLGTIEQNVATSFVRDHPEHPRKAALMMQREAKRMYHQLKDIGFPVLTPTDSFFFFNSLKAMDIKANVFQDRMLDNRIMVRDCASFGMPFDWYVRFCVKDPERNSMFVHAVHDVLRDLGW